MGPIDGQSGKKAGKVPSLREMKEHKTGKGWGRSRHTGWILFVVLLITHEMGGLPGQAVG